MYLVELFGRRVISARQLVDRVPRSFLCNYLLASRDVHDSHVGGTVVGGVDNFDEEIENYHVSREIGWLQEEIISETVDCISGHQITIGDG